jgi:integrase
MPRKFPPAKKRPYGHGSVSFERGHYVANYKSLETGRQVRKWFLTDREAQDHLDRWYADKLDHAAARERGASPRRRVAGRPSADPADLTFAELIDGWRAFKLGSVRATTWRNYEPALRALAHYLGDRRAGELTETHFVKYRQVREQGLDWVKRSRVAPLKAVTINQHLDRAHAVFEWALEASPPLVDQNPVARLVRRGNKLKVERFEPVVVEAEAIEALIGCASPEFRLEFGLMGHLALRWSEALGVGVGHLKDGKVLVRQQVIEDRTTKPYTIGVSSYGGKTKYARRDLWASDLILQASQQAYERPHETNPHRLLRPTRTGQPYRSNNWLRQAWAPALKRAGLAGSGLTPHGLRHSRLSIMAASGRTTLGDLSAFAGHASVAFTLTRYGDHFSSPGIRPELYLGTQAAG